MVKRMPALQVQRYKKCDNIILALLKIQHNVTFISVSVVLFRRGFWRPFRSPRTPRHHPEGFAVPQGSFPQALWKDICRSFRQTGLFPNHPLPVLLLSYLKKALPGFQCQRNKFPALLPLHKPEYGTSRPALPHLRFTNRW